MAQPQKQPAAQQAQEALPKILRIGVIQAGKIVEERLIRRRENVTIGASPRNNIVVPASTLPRSFILFEISGGKYYLSLTDTMDGRVSVGQKVMSLEQVRSEGHAKPASKGRLQLELTDSSRGKVLLGEVTLLFQFVAPPPVQPRPQLPPSVRGGLIGQMDWLFASSFGGSAVAIAAFLLILGNMEIPPEAAPDVVPEDFARFVPSVQTPKPKPKKKLLDAKKLAGEGEKKVEKVKAPPKVVRKRPGGKGRKGKKGTKKPAGKPCDEACKQARAEARRARLAAQVAKMGALKILGAKGPAGTGSTQNLLKGGDPGTSADKAFKGVGGVTTSGGGKGGGLRGKGAGGTGKSVGIGGLADRVGGPGKVGTGIGKVKEKVPTASIKKAGKTKIEGTLKASAVARVLRRGMRALKACYQKALKRNPKLAGKVAVILTINKLGKVTRVEIDQDTVGDSAVTSCIKSYCKRWRFPPPSDGDTVDVSFAVGFQASR
jgi:outer membrane biosynthesis protein TonB